MSSTNKKTLTLLAAVLVFLAFFMPWIKFFISISGWDLVMGDIGNLIDSPLRFIALLLPVSSLVIVFFAAFRQEQYPLPRGLLFSIPVATLVILGGIIAYEIEDHSHHGFGSSRADFDPGFFSIIGIGFWLTFIGSVVLPFLAGKSQPGIAPPPQATSPVAGTPVTAQQPAAPRIVINVPKVDWQAIFTKTQLFVRRFRILLITVAGLLISWIAVYYIFIKADPEKDGKLLAGNYCKCGEQLNRQNRDTINWFLSDFSSHGYTSRTEARNFLNGLFAANQERYTQCMNEANRLYAEKFSEYNADDGEDTRIFQQTYTTFTNSCSVSGAGELATLQQTATEKINTVIDPEPNEEKIKSDLLGSTVPGWTFQTLSEFQACSISAKTKNADRLEYTVDLKLAATNGQVHDAQLLLVYLLGENGWMLSQSKEIFITFTNTAIVGTWTEVRPLPNCTYRISNDKKFWVRDGTYGPGTKAGPGGEPYHLTSTTICIASREDVPIDLTFTYWPKNQ